jgi:hypothetical protein
MAPTPPRESARSGGVPSAAVSLMGGGASSRGARAAFPLEALERLGPPSGAPTAPPARLVRIGTLHVTVKAPAVPAPPAAPPIARALSPERPPPPSRDFNPWDSYSVDYR